MAVHQPSIYWLIPRYREQAPSHIGRSLGIDCFTARALL